MVLTAVGTVASGALSGAGGEMGRRTSERLCGLLGRARAEQQDASGDADGGGRQAPTLPGTDSERRQAALWLTEVAERSPGFAQELQDWLREASWLAPRAVPAVAHDAARPRMLPATTGLFTDREDVTAAVVALLDERGRAPGAPAVVALTGPGGIGKTATAVHTAHVLRERFPDGTLYVDLAGASAATALSPSEALVRFLERLGVRPAAVPGDERRQRDLYLDCTADRRMVIVLDNAHSDAQIMPLLPAAPHSLVLVTSRHRLDRLVAETGARHHTLPPLSTADSVVLLKRVVGRGRGRPEAPEDVVRAVAEATGGIPLAVCTTGAGLAVREHLPWQRVAEQLAERVRAHGREGAGVPDENRVTPAGADDPVHRAYDVSYRELTPQCAAFYRSLAVWPWPTLTVMSAAHAADVSREASRALLEELARVHLLEEVGEERYRLHDLSRAYAHELAVTEDGHGRMAAAVRRVAVGYLRFGAAADFRVMPLRWRLGPAYAGLRLPEHRAASDGKDALEDLRRERENLAAVVRAAEHHGFDDLVWQLCEAMWGLHLLLGFHVQWIETHRRGAEAARRSAAEFGDPRSVGRMLVQLAFGHMGAGQAEDAAAALAGAAAADEACGHHRGHASAVEALGLLRLKQWRYAEAERCFEEVREILERIGPGDDGWDDLPRARALVEHHVGRALGRRQHVAAALERLNDALARFRALPGGDPYNVGRVYMSLGETHLEAADPDLARVCLDQAVEAMETAGAGLQLADALELRARCHRSADRAADEAADLRTAALCHERNGDASGAARVRARLAELEP
ncbi:ATP-binding protein [Streptomyces sp. NPDC001852]|uniref:ATP-binding protein n=1 Tax=Streptomyces sp. NPDC001852 TaxID=3364619 RepID=UPI0036799E96